MVLALIEGMLLLCALGLVEASIRGRSRRRTSDEIKQRNPDPKLPTKEQLVP